MIELTNQNRERKKIKISGFVGFTTLSTVCLVLKMIMSWKMDNTLTWIDYLKNPKVAVGQGCPPIYCILIGRESSVI